MHKQVRRSSRLWMLARSGEKGRGNVYSLMVHPDILGWIFQSDVANQASVMALCSLMLVCKAWHQAVNVVLMNPEWLTPFTQSAALFIAGSIVLPFVPADELFLPAYHIQCYEILDSFLDEMQLHQWYQHVQHDGLLKMNKLLTWMIRKNLRLFGVTLRRMLHIVTDLMKVHDLVEKIQVAGCVTILLLGDLRIQFNCLRPDKSLILIGCIRNIRNFSLNASLMNDVVCIIDRFIKIGKTFEDTAVQAGVIQLVESVMAKHLHSSELHLTAEKLFKSMSLANFSYIQDAKLDKIVFGE